MAKAFTRLTGQQLGKTLVAKLTPVADSVRDLQVKFGLRPYLVRIVRTRWTGGERGDGDEVVSVVTYIEPTPKVEGVEDIVQLLLPPGRDEQGGVQISEISARYTEETLRGWAPDGTPADAAEDVFYEIELPRTDGRASLKRRFTLRGAPTYNAEQLQWTVRLERSHGDRTRAGNPT